MCGIFGRVGASCHDGRDLRRLALFARDRGKDSSGFVTRESGIYKVERADFDIAELTSQDFFRDQEIVAGHSRLITSGETDNQPVLRDGIAVLHNGIILNTESIWGELKATPELKIDSEVLPALARRALESDVPVAELGALVLSKCVGVVNCVMFIPEIGKLLLFSNNGSLFTGTKEGGMFFSSESHHLRKIGCDKISVVGESVVVDIPISVEEYNLKSQQRKRLNLLPSPVPKSPEAALLSVPAHHLLRCTKCILPETMPFIVFDSDGVCNYCLGYKSVTQRKPMSHLEDYLSQYRKSGSVDCVVPFSGGRDSSFGLHYAVRQLGLKPVAYTYDWGMVTDLGRRNISLMCGELGVENIVVAADISKKRRYIRDNLVAWLAAPHLGMISLLTAGDKNFFRFIENVKKNTRTDLNMWAVNPLEVTHFKSGFLGIKPDFAVEGVYTSGLRKQVRYHGRRFSQMLQNPRYFNASIWDSLSGEYFRSRKKDDHYFHLFDYVDWREEEINATLDTYGWERAEDTTTTWRIGDGTAGFYNYVYARVAGFTEHDTFRSNQIREGAITREDALEKVLEENQPRYQNIRWYLDTLGLDFVSVIKTVNSIPNILEKKNG